MEAADSRASGDNLDVDSEAGPVFGDGVFEAGIDPVSETSDSCGERHGEECQLGGCSWFVGVRLLAGVSTEGDLEGVQGRLRAP
ncbi:hypothetical protein OG762_16185 [Streptomyces sp. NBC_01136]|uniref:hypothetical protein n=1 Tax=Streptomyces sp. NBC_01136 TaxID=2903754 RepID=UPI00386393D6|nr:hypothetical protein OG762_16185 [Streptomyces sp. NBC_01136]